MKTVYKTIAKQNVGVSYFDSRNEALGVMVIHGIPDTARLVHYELGYAIQEYKSGPYFNLDTEAFE